MQHPTRPAAPSFDVNPVAGAGKGRAPAAGPFHALKAALHGRCGVADRLQAPGARMIRDATPEERRAFLAAPPTLAPGSVDAQGRAPGPRWSRARRDPFSRPTRGRCASARGPFAGDPLAEALSVGAPLAALLFRGFATGDLLALTGAAEIALDGSAVAAPPGAKRLRPAG